MKVFGPIPSRRLGMSIGVNNIPFKFCSYACVYCQLGRALHMTVQRRLFYAPDELFDEVSVLVQRLRNQSRQIDYLTIVPDGEPTLDLQLGALIISLKTLGIPVAVITNATLIDNQDVQDSLLLADWVSLKIDAVSDTIWRNVDRPHGGLNHDTLLLGMKEFSDRYKADPGKRLMTETMLIEGVNTQEDELQKLAQVVAACNPDTAYLSIPTRPPTESWVVPADECSLAGAYAQFTEYGVSCEYLIGYEGDAFSNSGDSRSDILSITAVHPMREDAVRNLIERNGEKMLVLDQLEQDCLVTITSFRSHRYVVRNFSSGRFL